MKSRYLMWLVALMLITSATFAQQNAAVTIHVVQRGETLFRIAQQYGVNLEDIARANGLINPANIAIGQRLLIPLGAVAQPAPPQTHTVQVGETLESIALFYGVDQQQVIMLNGIVNPNALYIGQVLKITEAQAAPPIAEQPVTESQPPIEVAAAVSDSGITHTIQRGETLFSIAQRYGVSISDIQALNNIASPSLIYAGQTLKIPGASGSTAPTQPAANLPPVLTGFNITPSTWTEGKTGRLIFTTRAPATVTAAFLNQTVPVVSLNGGLEHRVYFGVPLDTPANVYTLTLNFTESTGEVTVFNTNINVVSGGYWQQRISLPADQADLLGAGVEEAELNMLRSLTSTFSPQGYFSGPMSLPAAASMNVPFGIRRSYNGGPFDRYHNGSDFAAAAGSPILAAASGRVVMVDRLNIRGISVVIEHGWGVFSNYSHMSQANVNLGDIVQTGQVLGLVGTTGRTTGAHLHWEVWVNGTPVDPMQWVSDVFP